VIRFDKSDGFYSKKEISVMRITIVKNNIIRIMFGREMDFFKFLLLKEMLQSVYIRAICIPKDFLTGCG